jgi:predicted RNA-binding Zn-ribbon protein involved in translation (DUF1610 family)
MSCAICDGKKSVSCPNCGAGFCNHCAERFAILKESGGLFGDKHLEFDCPKCGSSIRIR